MVYVQFGPQWFTTFAIIMEFVFMLVTGLIAYRSYKCYQFLKNKESLVFAVSFGTFSLSYLTIFVVNALNYLNNHFNKDHLLAGLNTVCEQVSTIAPVGYLAFNIFMVLTLIGLTLLIYLTFEVKNKRLLVLLIMVVLLSIIAAFNTISFFYVITTLFYFFIVEFYSRKKKQMTFLGFVFLLLGNMSLVFVNFTPLAFFGGHVLMFIGFLILANILRISCTKKNCK